ncbi:hypothetical protein QYM41_16610 [Kocuria sp. CPCC 205268]|uniref:hypothetical protein n=1 Tax=Kocuria oxytropis TaxID=3058913 RepID=UPI0034D75383
MNPLIDLIAPLLAAAASAAGIPMALGQLTLAARLRHQAAYWREEAESKSPTFDRSVAQSLQRETTAKLLALHAVPGRQLLLAALVILLGLGWAATTASYLGTIPTDSPVRESLTAENRGVTAAGLGMVLLVCYGIMRWSNSIQERRRIAQAYLDGQSLVARSVDGFAGRQTVDQVGWQGVAVLLSLGVGLWCLSVFIGFAQGFSTRGVTEGPPWFSWLLSIGVFCLICSAVLGPSCFARAPWKHPHPRPLQEKEGDGITPCADVQSVVTSQSSLGRRTP